MRDTRTESLRRLGRALRRPISAVGVVGICLLVAALVAYVPQFPGLPPAGRVTLAILTAATLLWITEAMPAFAVGVSVMAAEIALLGRPGGVFAKGPDDWEMFVRPWGSPVIWLFLGGLVLARAATKTGLDHTFASAVVSRVGHGPRSILVSCMAITFVFSMFISNTASTAMMMAVVAPILSRLPDEDPFGRVLCLAIAFGASLGGMGTPIGSPPNAVVLGLLGESAPSFGMWMLAAVPPAVVLSGVCAWWLCRGLPDSEASGTLADVGFAQSGSNSAPPWMKSLVLVVFTVTVCLWLTAGLHSVPVAVVSFLPLAVLTTARVVEPDDIRALPWDVLLLLAGGLSLGVAVQETGLAAWFVQHVAPQNASPLWLALGLGAVACVLSNFMSNTAATNILAPLALAMVGTGSSETLVSLALCASLAVALPVSTPPNAIAYATGRLQSHDFWRVGVMVAVLGVPLVVFWNAWLVGPS